MGHIYYQWPGIGRIHGGMQCSHVIMCSAAASRRWNCTLSLGGRSDQLVTAASRLQSWLNVFLWRVTMPSWLKLPNIKGKQCLLSSRAQKPKMARAGARIVLPVSVRRNKPDIPKTVSLNIRQQVGVAPFRNYVTGLNHYTDLLLTFKVIGSAIRKEYWNFHNDTVNRFGKSWVKEISYSSHTCWWGQEESPRFNQVFGGGWGWGDIERTSPRQAPTCIAHNRDPIIRRKNWTFIHNRGCKILPSVMQRLSSVFSIGPGSPEVNDITIRSFMGI